MTKRKTVCKFNVSKIIPTTVGSEEKAAIHLEAHPVIGGSDENDIFFAATPSGLLELTAANVEALSGIQAGDDILLTIEKVEKETAAEGTAPGAAEAGE
jgi:hypothetical protein